MAANRPALPEARPKAVFHIEKQRMRMPACEFAGAGTAASPRCAYDRDFTGRPGAPLLVPPKLRAARMTLDILE